HLCGRTESGRQARGGRRPGGYRSNLGRRSQQAADRTDAAPAGERKEVNRQDAETQRTASARNPQKDTERHRRGTAAHLCDSVSLCGLKAIAVLGALSVLAVRSISFAQAPKINAFFPIGGKAETTVEVEVRGSSLSGADTLIA